MTVLNRTASPGSRTRVPSNLLDLYVRYKQDTRAVIDWLLGHGTSKHRSLRTLSIKDLFGLAKIVQAKEVEMPDTISYHFREAIAARTQLSKFFQEENGQELNEEETCKHVYFTKSLSKIYTDLCECCAKPKEKCMRVQQPSRCEAGGSTSRNVFLALESNCFAEEWPPELELSEQKWDTGVRGPSIKETLPLPFMDDNLAEALEYHKEIQDMSDLVTVTAETWEQAARGEIPLVLAAFITHAIFAEFEGIEIRLKAMSDSSDSKNLLKKFVQMEETLGMPKTDESDVEVPAKRLVESLQDSWQLLLKTKAEGPERQRRDALAASSRPSQLVLRKGPDSTSTDEECLKAMLQNIGLHLQATYLKNGVIRLGTPLYAEVGYLLTNNRNDNNGLRCSYGLRLLIESYKSYQFALQPTVAVTNCRLHALRFAQEAMTSIRSVLDNSTMPCRCHGTLAFHLGNVLTDIEDFLHVRVFNFYFQSPWVSASHILEMLETLFYYGLRLFSYRTHVTSILHTYHVLRTFTDMPSMQLLEHLNERFSNIVFPGGRPTRNFTACYARSMGGRLRFNPHNFGHKTGCHSMVIPAHTAKATAGLRSRSEPDDPRFDYRKTSLLHHVKKRGYHPDIATWDRVHMLGNNIESPSPQKGRKNTACSYHEHLDKSFSSCPARSRMQILQNAILTELTGPFPTARINFFQVYLACTRAISTISDRYHGKTARPGQNCFCFVDAIVAAADRCRENEYRLQPFGSVDLVRFCREAIMENLGGHDMDPFLWKGL